MTNKWRLESPVHQLLLQSYGSTTIGNQVQKSMAFGWHPQGGGSQEEHLTILVEVFGRLQEHGIMVNTAKYIFSSRDLSFLDTGVSNATFVLFLSRWMRSLNPNLTNATDLRSYLGQIWRLHCILFMTCSKRKDLGTGRRSVRTLLWTIWSSYKFPLLVHY